MIFGVTKSTPFKDTAKIHEGQAQHKGQAISNSLFLTADAEAKRPGLLGWWVPLGVVMALIEGVAYWGPPSLCLPQFLILHFFFLKKKILTI